MLHVALGAHTPIVCAMFMSQEISQLSMAQGHVTQIKRQSHQPQKKEQTVKNKKIRILKKNRRQRKKPASCAFWLRRK